MQKRLCTGSQPCPSTREGIRWFGLVLVKMSKQQGAEHPEQPHPASGKNCLCVQGILHLQEPARQAAPDLGANRDMAGSC